MIRVTFGVCASSFIANMCVKQNALDHSLQYPLAAKAVDNAFYVNDGVTGADCAGCSCSTTLAWPSVNQFADLH